jgi:hypothetical protein
MKGSGNLGAIQCSTAEQSAGSSKPYYTCVDYGDHTDTGKAYAVKFKFYQDADGKTAQEWAALDYLWQFWKLRPRSAALIAQGATVERIATQLYHEHYFGNYKGVDTDPAVMAKAVGDYVRAIISHAPSVAAVLGQDLALTQIPTA